MWYLTMKHSGSYHWTELRVHFRHYWSFVLGIHWLSKNSPHKGTIMQSLDGSLHVSLHRLMDSQMIREARLFNTCLTLIHFNVSCECVIPAWIGSSSNITFHVITLLGFPQVSRNPWNSDLLQYHVKINEFHEKYIKFVQMNKCVGTLCII